MSDRGPYRAGLAGLVILAVGIGLLSAPGAADAQTRLKYLTGARELTMIPVFVAEDQGYFRNQGLALEITLMPGAPLVISGVVGGDAAFGQPAIPALLKAVQGGLTVLMVANFFDRHTQVGVIRKEALPPGMTPETYLALPLDERVRLLKGRKLGIAGVGGLIDVVSRFLVRWAGLNPDVDVDLVNVGNTPTMLGAIRARRIDAFLLTPPIPFQVERDGIAIVYYSGPKGDLPALRELYSTVLVTAPAYAQRHPEIVRKMARSIAQANAYARQQREATAALMHRLFPQIEPEVVRQSTLAVIDALSPDARFSTRAIDQQIRILMDGGFLSKKPIPAEEGTFWTNRFLN